MGRKHVPEGTDIDYNSSPPTSGPHWPTPAPWGVYSSALPDEQLVHNLEHGGIWISYGKIDRDTRQALETLAGRYPQAVILTPRPQNDAPIALASWGRLQTLSSFDEQRIVNFITSNVNRSPEPLASVDPPAMRVGEPFPEFRVRDVDGRVITRETLAGRPSIVWFTTTYCVPCQVGALQVSRLDDELGGRAFNVLVLFVDPREPTADLRAWKTQFARDDWLVAMDTDLAPRVELRFLDSKFLLDPRGVVRNIDFNVADDRYLEIVRREVDRARR